MRKIIVLVLFGLSISSVLMAGEVGFSTGFGKAPIGVINGVYNSSGGRIALGSVVVWSITPMAYTTDSNTDRLCITTSSLTDTCRVAGVVVGDTINTASYGSIQVYGYCPFVLVNATTDTVTAGELIGTSSTSTIYGYCGSYAGATDGGTIVSSTNDYKPLGMALETSVSGTTSSIKAILFCW